MEIVLPHNITYIIERRPDADNVAQSILSQRELLTEAALLLGELLPGLTIEEVRVQVVKISQESPLKEAFLIALLATYQGKINEAAPKIVEALAGRPVSDEYNVIISLIALAICFFGVQAAIDIIRNGINKAISTSKYDELVKIVSEDTNIPEEDIRKKIDAIFKSRRKGRLIRSSLRLFAPAKHEPTASVIIADQIEIPPSAVLEVPSVDQFEATQIEDTSKPMENVAIKVVAQDEDKGKGWAGIIPEINESRLKMEIYPPLRPHEIYLRREVRGDIILVSKPQDDGSFKPYKFHLVRLRD